MRRTKRRARYTWLPTLGTAGPAETDDNSSGRAFTLTIPQDTSSNVIISAITFDEPLEGDDAVTGTPLGTILGNEYFLKRIVGKLFLAVSGQRQTNNDPSTVISALVGAGFFVARANDTSQGAGSPIGSATLSERQENYSPLSEDAIREPWIWRRTWILGNPNFADRERAVAAANQSSLGLPFSKAPSTNMEYGSVLDGPHIDAKTARRIKQDERLWFVIAGRSTPGLTAPVTDSLDVQGYLDFRLLGALRKARQGSAF